MLAVLEPGGVLDVRDLIGDGEHNVCVPKLLPRPSVRSEQ